MRGERDLYFVNGLCSIALKIMEKQSLRDEYRGNDYEKERWSYKQCI